MNIEVYDDKGDRDYRSLAGSMLVQMYNSTSTIDTFAKLLEEFENALRLEIDTDGNND